MSKRGFEEISWISESNEYLTCNFDDEAFDYFMDPSYFTHDYPVSPANDDDHVLASPCKKPKIQHNHDLEPLLEEPVAENFTMPIQPTNVTIDEAYADLLAQSIGGVSAMETSLAAIVSKIEQSDVATEYSDQFVDQQQLIECSPIADPYCSKGTAESMGEQGIDMNLTLSEDTPVPAVWYCDRPFPHLTLQVTNNLLQPVHIERAQISMRILNGFGDDATQKAFGNMTSRLYPVCPTFRRATIAGLRFSAVSSKQGGCFRLVANLCVGGNILAEWKSDPIQILSYRLYHAPKIPTERLTGRDSVGKMKGIGAQYAKRLKTEGIHTVGDLAALDMEGLGHQRCEELLQRIRKDRGAMTLAKLSDYVFQARDIVARSLDSSSNLPVPTRASRNSF